MIRKKTVSATLKKINVFCYQDGWQNDAICASTLCSVILALSKNIRNGGTSPQLPRKPFWAGVNF